MFDLKCKNCNRDIIAVYDFRVCECEAVICVDCLNERDKVFINYYKCPMCNELVRK
jgi:hypothetical protein